MKTATVDDYKKWLIGYVKHEGSPQNAFVWKQWNDKLLIAQKDFKLIPLYGASLLIIVPTGVRFSGFFGTRQTVGHSEIAFEDGKTINYKAAPVYYDVVQEMLYDNSLDPKEFGFRLVEGKPHDSSSSVSDREFFWVRE